MRTIDADALKKALEVAPYNDIDDFVRTERLIDDAPTVEERPTGEWEIVDAEGSKIWNCVCTECGHDPQEYIGGTENWWLRKTHLPNFCPNCGVRIVNVKGGNV